MAKAAALVACGTLGALAAFEATVGRADPPANGAPATVYRTIVETRTVAQRLDGKPVRWWAKRARANAHTLRRQRITLHRIQRHAHARWTPTVTYAIHLAANVFNVSEAKMRQVAWCESTFNPFATNGRYHGLFQLGWSPYGMSPYDPVANALSTAQTVAHDGSWRQWECG